MAIDKDTGNIIEQYQLAAGDTSWSDLRGIAVVPGASGAPAMIYWIDKTRLMSSTLVAIPTPGPSASPSAAPSPSPSVKPKPTKKPTPKPTKKP